ncbi:hypothetical protein DPMN_099681 [Dreissena polymorpha]|uniref:Uncharacterized protein n=1 Tax=Dreissena polymorpha TaxID=45954 RepID=A0A9D4LGT2_DREPO|nr:hypothetical protein DPMN_099681 [Dreissena polymorpha]
MAEAERIRNDRPIMRVSNDPKDPPALTPNRLLLMRSNACLPRYVGVTNSLPGRCILATLDTGILTTTANKTAMAEKTNKSSRRGCNACCRGQRTEGTNHSIIFDLERLKDPEIAEVLQARFDRTYISKKANRKFRKKMTETTHDYQAYVPLRPDDGRHLLTGSAEVLNRWTKSISDLYNYPLQPNQFVLPN